MIKIGKIKLRSAVKLNDSEMKAVRGRFGGSVSGCSMEEVFGIYSCSSGICETYSNGEYVFGTCFTISAAGALDSPRCGCAPYVDPYSYDPPYP